jgi:hypothetical protein
LSVLRFYKDIREKFQKLYLILKEQRYYQQVLITLRGCGMLRLEKCYKLYKAIKIKYFHANSITKETPLLQAQRITLVAFGEIHNLSKNQN